jgi:hypothetical protein
MVFILLVISCMIDYIDLELNVLLDAQREGVKVYLLVNIAACVLELRG